MLLLLLLLLRGSSTSSVFPALFRSRRPSIAPSQSRSWWQEIFPQVPSFCCLCASGRELPPTSSAPSSSSSTSGRKTSADLDLCFVLELFPLLLSCFVGRSQTGYVLSHSPRPPFLSDLLPLFSFSFHLPFPSACRSLSSFPLPFSVLLLVTFSVSLLFTHLFVITSPSLSVFPSSVSSSSFLSSCDSSSSSSCSSPHH